MEHTSIKGYTRRAHFAGGWYSQDKKTLNGTIDYYLSNVNVDDDIKEYNLRGVIVPHAGISYSGGTAAYAYHYLRSEICRKESPIKHIIVFHPSHRVYLNGVELSGASLLETPLGNLPVDTQLREEINSLKPGAFKTFNKKVDELEHSGEMQYIFIAKILNDVNKINGNPPNTYIPVLPVMCGSLSSRNEQIYGKLLSDIVSRPDVLSIVSTDFCHWGEQFDYRPRPTPATCSSFLCTVVDPKVSQKEKTITEISDFIQSLDAKGMQLISRKKPIEFTKYLAKTRNTICGKHAISLWLNSIVHLESCQKESDVENNENLVINFVNYSQSSKVANINQSSVSYAAAIAIKPGT